MGNARRITFFIILYALSVAQKKIEREVFNKVKTSRIMLDRTGKTDA